MLKQLSNEKCWVEMYGTVKVWSKGQIVIPNNLRKALWIEVWDSLVIWSKHWKLAWMIKPWDIDEFTLMYRDELNSSGNLNCSIEDLGIVENN